MKTTVKGFVVLVATVLMILSLSVCTGPQGVTGPQGTAGPQGVTGLQGAAGPQGATGPQGLAGLQGVTGPQGSAGPQGATGPQGPAGPSDGSGSTSIVSVIANVAKAIVRIYVDLGRFDSSGSGSIIDKRGYLLTNYHVVEGAQTVQVTVTDMGVFQGTVVAVDPNRDVALVKITSTRTDFPTVTFGQMSDVLVGVEVYAIGFPLGADLPGPATVTRGIISAQRVMDDGLNYIQIDASINPGNSGGCLFVANGNMIGIPSAVIAPEFENIENVGLAVPIDDILTFLQKNLPK